MLDWRNARKSFMSTLFADAGIQRIPLVLDAAWILDNGALALDGWCALPSDQEPLVVRTVRGRIPLRWFPLVRKERPDVLGYLKQRRSTLPCTESPGFVGYVEPGTTDDRERVKLEFRCGRFRRLVTTTAVTGPVPEEVFHNLLVEAHDLTRRGLSPLVNVMRHTTLAQPPRSTTAYRAPRHREGSTVNVVVPVYGSTAYARSLLMSFSHADARWCGLTLVCDDPDIADEFVSQVSSWNDAVFHGPVQVLVHDRNAGFSHACNTGWRSAASEYQLLLNSDVVAPQIINDVQLLVTLLDKGAAAVAPALLYPDATIQHAGMEMRRSMDFPDFVLPIHPGKGQPQDQLPRLPFAVPLLSGAAVLTKTASLEQAGGVPVVYGRGDFEDVLLSRALRRIGDLLVEPRVRWMHTEAASYPRHRDRALTLAKSVFATERQGLAL